MIIYFILLVPHFAFSAVLRLEGDRAWLESDNVPLQRVLRLFEERGVEVLIDPSLQLRRISGEWENTTVDRLVEQLVSPHSYSLRWKRVPSPLGDLYQMDVLRVFSDGNMAAARPLTAKRNHLDVITGADGIAYIRGEILVGFGDGATLENLNKLLKQLNGTVIEAINPPGIYRIRLNEGLSVEDAVHIAEKDPFVKKAEPNLAYKQVGSTSVSLAGTGEGVNLHLQPGEKAVAVLDSGLDAQYADLPFIRGTYNALDPSGVVTDPSGHGTMMALMASGAITPVGESPAETGVPVLAIQAFDDNGYTSTDTILRAIKYAEASGVAVINMSWGSEVESSMMEAAMNYAAQQDIVLYAAAGNEPTGTPIYPAGYYSVIAVGGLNPDGSLWEYSNTGNFVKVYEPAKAVFNGKVYQGTSFSSAFGAHKAAAQK